MTVFAEFNAFKHVQATKRTYTPTEELKREIHHAGSGEFVICPVGKAYDVSSPWWATPLFDPHDRTIIPAAMVHDQMLRDKYPATVAAAEFYRCLRERGCPKLKSIIALFAVIVATVK